MTKIIIGTIEDNGPRSSALSKTPVILVAQALIVLSSFQLIRKRIQKKCNFQMSVDTQIHPAYLNTGFLSMYFYGKPVVHIPEADEEHTAWHLSVQWLHT